MTARTGTFPNIKASRLHHLDNDVRESNLPSTESDKVISILVFVPHNMIGLHA